MKTRYIPVAAMIYKLISIPCRTAGRFTMRSKRNQQKAFLILLLRTNCSDDTRVVYVTDIDLCMSQLQNYYDLIEKLDT